MPIERDQDFFSKARDRYKEAKDFWAPIYNEMDIDLRYVTGDQWDAQVKTARANEQGRPVLTFDVLHTNCQLVENGIRQQKPAIKISPESQGATKEGANIRAGIIRHWNYMSQGDTARDTAVGYATKGGIGFYRIGTKYTNQEPKEDDPDAFDQDATIDWIRDPKTVYFDPEAIEMPDFSSADWCFIVHRMSWERYESKYGERSAVTSTNWDSFDDGDSDLGEWATKDEVTVAEYFYYSHKKSTVSINGRKREFDVRTLHQDFMNGVEVLSETTFPVPEIPVIPVLGEMTMVEGKTKIASLIRYVRDAQMLRNAYKSGIAENIGLANRVPFTGPRGMFKNPDWRDANVKNPSFLEWDLIYDNNGNLAPFKPERPSTEAAIQALTASAAIEADDIKAGMGIYDSSLGAAKSEYSGVSVEKRTEQADVTNYHFGDNLNRAMWREGQILLAMIKVLVDTPRAMHIMDEVGQTSEVLVHQKQEDGSVPMVHGREDEEHHRLDVGRYVVTTGRDYVTEADEEYEQWMQFLSTPGGAPLAPAFLPVILQWSNTPGADKLAKVALAVAPPAVQAVVNGGPQPLDPQVQQQMAAANEQMNALQAENMQLKFEKAAKTQELQAKHSITVEQNTVDLLKAEIAAKNKETVELVQQQFTAFQQMLEHNQQLMLQHHQGQIDTAQAQQQQQAAATAQGSDQAHQAAMAQQAQPGGASA